VVGTSTNGGEILGDGTGEGGGTCRYKSNHTSNSFERPSLQCRSHFTYMKLSTNSLCFTLTQYVTRYMLPVTAKQNSGLKQKFQAKGPYFEHASHHLTRCYIKTFYILPHNWGYNSLLSYENSMSLPVSPSPPLPSHVTLFPQNIKHIQPRNLQTIIKLTNNSFCKILLPFKMSTTVLNFPVHLTFLRS